MFTKEEINIDGVPIYINKEQLLNYYAESYFLYRNHLNHLSQKVNKFKSYENNSERKKFFSLLKKAYLQNGNNVNEIVSKLKDKVTISAFENLRINPTDNLQNTLKDFVYLRRDWCFLEEAEKQLKTTIDSLKQELSIINHKKNSSLFLGCGVGRLAYEFTDIYEKVYATDKSFSMIWHLQKLLRGESVNFFNPQEKNVHRLENVAQPYEAKIPVLKLKTKDKFYAFVSDILDIPFQPKSINSIFSIYFTDVIALKLWFQQIDNKLSDNGLFIHFGPLDYFFTDEREMLSAEEFRMFFEKKGYKTLSDKIIETPHLEDSNSITYKVYRNWVFIAQKQTNNLPEKFVINDNTVLKIKHPIQFERKGVIKDGEKQIEASIKLPSGIFNGAESVIQILKLIDGKKSFKDLITTLNENGFQVDSQEIKNLLLKFLKQDIISND